MTRARVVEAVAAVAAAVVAAVVAAAPPVRDLVSYNLWCIDEPMIR